MRKGESTRTYTADDLKAMRRRGEDRTDWSKVDTMTEPTSSGRSSIMRTSATLSPTGHARSWSCPGRLEGSEPAD